jgi:uncharacterized DUF497 family protein
MPIQARSTVVQKLQAKHKVDMREVSECFDNRAGNFIEDTRARHRTFPPTYWFIAETNKGRALKVVFVPDANDLWIKSAFEPNQDEIELYLAKCN